ncbi:TonB-dependent siderophore receptor [Neptunomonas sp. XY-337]|uniref:TonB-dependent receptor n=1 Tax=Neptunomonas sp. XY-337 TaxID=2561897 RepID=UPI0010AADC57|nr:TonB-dependent siderophore receptor [Neptunomonas sp. XY-337]
MKPAYALKPLSAGILLAVTTMSAQSQETVVNESITVQGDVFSEYAAQLPTSGTKTDLPWLDVPQAVSVVTGTEMHDRGAVRLVDALQGVAGMNNTLGEGSRDQFVIRGFDGLNDLYRDGMRDEGRLQSYRSLANVERVEVVKGAAGALYGRGSAGGLINLVTKRANGEKFTRVVSQVGTDGVIVGRVDTSGQISEGVNARLNMEYRQSDSFVDNVDSEDFFIAPTIRIQPNEQHTVDVDVEFAHQELVPYRGVPSKDGLPVDVPVETFFGGTDDYQEFDSLRLAVTHEMQISPEVKWTNRAAWNSIELEQKGTRQGRVTGNEVSQTVNNFAYDPRTIGTLQSELAWETADNQLLVGVDYNKTDIDLRYAKYGALSSQPLYDPVTRTTLDPGFAPWRDNTTETFGVFAQNVHSFGDLSLVANVRYDQMDLEQRKVGKDKEYLDDDKVSYRAGAVYRLNPNVSLYATAARSWQLPYSGIYINPKLAEFFHTDLLEVGAKGYLLDDALMVNMALFQIEQEQPKTNVSGDVVAKQEVRHRGIELEARGELTPRWNIAAGYSYLEAEDTATGLKPNDVSDHLFSLWSTYQLDSQWKVGAGVKYVGERYAGNGEKVKLDDYMLLDMMVRYQWRQHSLQLNAKNLLDETYYLGATGGGSGLNQIGYGAPAQFLLTYNYQF